MLSERDSFAGSLLLCCLTIAIGGLVGCTNRPSEQKPVDLKLNVTVPFRFVVYGDTRFHDPNDSEAANPAVRVTLVHAIAEANPAFVCFTGDVVYNGYDTNDWKVWDYETSIWRDKGIPIYPALGNHDLHGDENIALANYFQRFPELKNNRYYSFRAANTLILVLDSALAETDGPQGQWLVSKLDNIPSDVDFLFVIIHHPPYTSSSDAKKFGGGHSARLPEQQLAKMLEKRQSQARARFFVFSGHVHNYERHEHGGVTYFVSGGGAAHAYPIERAPDDPFQSKQVNYHYLLVEVEHQHLKVIMRRVELNAGKAAWTEPDSVNASIATGTAGVPPNAGPAPKH
jgi:Icc-related predicted phosphoesterase